MFPVKNTPALNHNDILSWFDGCKEGKIEGIVWHCNDGYLIKVMWKAFWFCHYVSGCQYIEYSSHVFGLKPKLLFCSHKRELVLFVEVLA